MGLLRAPLLVWLMVLGLPAGAGGDVPDEAFAAALKALEVRSFASKGEAIASLERLGDPRALGVFEAMLRGRLYYRKADKRVVLTQVVEDGYRIVDPVSGTELGVVSKRALRKIGINNTLRRRLRAAIARLSLDSEDPGVRLAAVQELLANMTPEAAALLREAEGRERDRRVAGAIRIALALNALDSTDKSVRLRAVRTLKGSVDPTVRNRLTALITQRDDGAYGEPDPEVRAEAARALRVMDSKLQLYRFAETAFFGLSLGSVLLLAAIGLAITFGVMGVINMAHGELIMLGAYTTYVVQLLMPNHIDLSLLVAVPAAFLISGAFGVAIERGVIRFLYGRPLETLLATFGISLILQQLVRSVFSPLNRAVSTPSWMEGSLELSRALSLTYNRLYIVIFSLVVFFALLLILKRTSLGLQVRAVAQNRPMAKAMGIRTDWVDAMTFGLGSGIAGVAGVALSQLTNVGPNLGQAYIIDSFMVVVFGGVGNLWGTLLGALTLGVATKFIEPHAGAVLAKILILVFIIIFIQKRPRGLFPQKGRGSES